jgi:hypothetical protein
MANLGFKRLEKSSEYINLENEFDFSFVEGKIYHIQIQGAGMFCEQSTKPLSGGVFWDNLKPFDYTKAADTLWVKIQSPVGNINIWE